MYTFSSKKFITFLLVFSVLAGIFLHRHAGTDSFWFDELWTISSVRSSFSLSDTANVYASIDNSSPLFPFMFYFWYRVFPHTEQALRALTIILALLACITVGIIGRKLCGFRYGAFAFMFMVCNYSLLGGAALELRPYSLLILLCAVNYGCYLARLRRESWFMILLYGLTMGLIVYTHYLSVVFCVGLFLADCFMIAKGRAGFKVIFSYILGAAIFCPWAYTLLTCFDSSKILNFWPAAPTLRSILDLSKYLTGAACFLSVLFLSAVLGLFCVMRNLFSKQDKPSVETAFMSAGIFASAFMVLAVFVYSAFINPNGSCFVDRYFFPTVPFVALTSAMGADFMYSSMKAVFARKAKVLFAALFVIIAVVSLGKAAKHKIFRQPYREAVNLIRVLEADHTGKSAIVTTDPAEAYEGWREMYLSSPDEFTVYLIGSEHVLDDLTANMYSRIYFMFQHESPSKLKKGIEVLKWLHEHYDFGEHENYLYNGREEDCMFQVLELRR